MRGKSDKENVQDGFRFEFGGEPREPIGARALANVTSQADDGHPENRQAGVAVVLSLYSPLSRHGRVAADRRIVLVLFL
jgi:hypothetical protein